jgi:hypothetical protein
MAAMAAGASKRLSSAGCTPHRLPTHRSGLFQDNVYCHITSGLGAGLFAVLCGSPVDVVKSRMMSE